MFVCFYNPQKFNMFNGFLCWVSGVLAWAYTIVRLKYTKKPTKNAINTRSYKMSIIGYIRVSSDKQTLEHQRFEITQFAKQNNLVIDDWVAETISSRQPLKKRKLGKLLNKLQSDDTLIACEISRLGRSLMEVMRILENCLIKNCKVWTIKENYRLGNDIQSKVMAFAFGLSAEIERNLISQRTKASLDNIKATGKKLGRPLSAKSRELKLAKNTRKIRKLLDSGTSTYKIAKILGVQPITVIRFIQRMEW